MSSEDIRSQSPEERLKTIINQQVTYNHDIPLQRFFRSGKELITQGDSYLKDGEYEKCCIFYMRYIVLFVEKVPKHPEFKTLSADQKKEMKKKLKEVLNITEELKPQLKEKYAKEHEAYLLEKEKRDKELYIRQQQQKTQQLESKSNHQSVPSLKYDRIEALDETYKQIKYVNPLPDNIYPNFETVFSSPSETNSITTSSSDIPPPAYSTISPVPIFDRTKKPIVPQTKPEYTSSPNYLRPVVVPSQLLSSFVLLAQRNTDKNVETCGILAGRVIQNELHITHLLVPKQAGTADSCVTHHEEEIFSYQDQYNLITLGWIHTHPSQTAFLSSVDLHTHCSYQLMMPEAIAIVCAPKHNEQGVFCLTPHYGLDVIANCRQTTGFHPHPNDVPLFMIAEHSRIDYHSAVEVIDLRTS